MPTKWALFEIFAGNWYFYLSKLIMFVYLVLIFFFLGPVMTKFTLAFREIGTYKETLRSQVVILVLLLVLLLLFLFLPQFCTVTLCCLLTIWKIFGKQSWCFFIVSSFYYLPYVIIYWTLYALFYGINISCKDRLIREKVIDK